MREVPKVGGTKDVNVAKLIATEPTHVIVNIDENRKDTVDHLRRVIPNVIVTHPLLPEDNATLFALLGHIFSVEDAGLALAASWPPLASARAVGATCGRNCAVSDLEEPVDDRLARHLRQRDAGHRRLENAAHAG